MGPDGAVNIIFRNELAEAEDPRRPARGADRRVPRAVREPVHRRRARLRRRGDRAAAHAAGADRRAADRDHEARAPAAAQARQHPALAAVSGRGERPGLDRLEERLDDLRVELRCPSSARARERLGTTQRRRGRGGSTSSRRTRRRRTRSARRAGSRRRESPPDSRRRPSARAGAAPSRRSARRRGSRASGSRSADGVRSTRRSSPVSEPGLRRISSGIASLPRSCRLAASRVSSTSSAGSPSCSAILAGERARRARSGCRVRRRARRRRARATPPREARGAVGRLPRAGRASARRPPRLGEPHLVLAVLLRPVERAVGEPDQRVALASVLRERRDAGADGDRRRPGSTSAAPRRLTIDCAIASAIGSLDSGSSTANSSPPSRNASPP